MLAWRGFEADMPMPSSSMCAPASTRPSRHASSPWVRAVGSRSSCAVGRAFGARTSPGSTTRSPASERKVSNRDSVFCPLLASCSLRWPLSRTMKRLSPVTSIWPLRAVVTDSTLPREATMKTLRPRVVSLAAPSKKKVRSPSPELWNCPGATRERSERRSNTSFSWALRSFCQGQTKRASRAISSSTGQLVAAPAGRALQRDAAGDQIVISLGGTCATASRRRRRTARARASRQVAESDEGEQQCPSCGRPARPRPARACG